MKRQPSPEWVAVFSTCANDRDATIGALTTELVEALTRASGDEKKLRDTVFLFVHQANTARVAARWLPEIFGTSVARSSLSPGERETVFQMFPQCHQFVVRNSERAAKRGRWWKWHHPRASYSMDIGQHCI
jgi:hypothetical protein